MTKKILKSISGWVGLMILPTAILLSTCNSNTGDGNTTNVIKDLGFMKIETTPSNFKNYEAKDYTRYVGYKAPNGKNIHILIQDKLTEFQIARAYNILDHYLKIDTNFSYDKSQVANTMANNSAILKLQNGTHSEDNEDNLFGQPLYQNEIQAEGDEWYMKQDYTHRDASYEEILHLVHDYGFGVLNSGTGIAGALPQLQLDINRYQKLAWNNKIWTPKTNEYNEWKDEISLDQEYFASVIDAYYGLWGAWTDSRYPNKSMWGVYNVKTRLDFGKDGVITAVQELLHSTLQYTAYMSDQLSGKFSLKYDASKPYTNHSQYLTKIKLNGKNDVKVIVNKHNNVITGNDGYTTVVFNGKENDYMITYAKDGKTPLAVIGNKEGNNTLHNVDAIEFLNN